MHEAIKLPWRGCVFVCLLSAVFLCLACSKKKNDEYSRKQGPLPGSEVYQSCEDCRFCFCMSVSAKQIRGLRSSGRPDYCWIDLAGSMSYLIPGSLEERQEWLNFERRLPNYFSTQFRFVEVERDGMPPEQQSAADYYFSLEIKNGNTCSR